VGYDGEAFSYRDRGSMAIVGRGAAVAEVRGRRFDGPLAWILWLLIHLAYLVDFRTRSVVLLRWTWLLLTRRRPGLLLTDRRLPVRRVAVADPMAESSRPTGAVDAAPMSESGGSSRRCKPSRDPEGAAETPPR
jgi:NADH dehydrogenase